MKRLIKFLVGRPLLANLITVFILLAGALSLDMLTFETMPKVDLGLVNISTARPGAGPQDMELSVTAPLEEELLEVSGVSRVVSHSMEGLSVITAQIDPDAPDRAQVLAAINKAVDRGAGALPRDVIKKPQVREMSSTEFPVIELHITGDVSEGTLRSVARTVSEGLRQVDGIGGVDKVGYRNREVRVQLDPHRLERLGISYAEVHAAIAARNLRSAGGSIDSVVAERNVLTIGAFEQPKSIEEVVVRVTDPGNMVRIRDIADVVMDYEPRTVENRVDGRFAIALGARTKAGADGLQTSEAVKAFVERTRATLPPGVEILAVNDISRFTKDMLRTLVSNALLGLALVLFMLRLFFGWRLSIWVAVGLPVAFALTFAGMSLIGLSVNILTLISLILVLGMLVDDAIVTGESIQAHREKGLTPEQASVQGTHAVARPVFASALTTILAFAPAAFLGGLEGEFLWALPVMVGLALAGSLFDCKLLLPAHLAHGELEPVSSTGFDRLRVLYRALIEASLRRRGLVTSLFVVGFVLIMTIGGAAVRFNLYPEMEIDTFHVKVELPEGASFARTREATARVEALIREQIPEQEIDHIVARIGHHDTDMYGGTEGRNSAWALVTTYLRPQGERQIRSNDAIKSLRAEVKELPGFASLVVEPMDDSPKAGKPLELEVIGGDERFALVSAVTQYLQEYPGVTETFSSDRPGKHVVRLSIDHARLAARGLTVADVSRAVRVAFDGELVSQLQLPDERLHYRLTLSNSKSNRLASLESLTVPNAQGQHVKLRGIVDLVEEPGEATIKRYLGRRTTTIYADIDRMTVSVQQLNDDVAAFIDEAGFLRDAPELRVHFGGEAEQQRQAMGNVGSAFLLCCAAILFTLVVLFNSLSQPFLVMSVIPFGLCGVIVGFAGQGLELSMIALIGVVGLAGVLVNDSLVMVSRLNDRKTETGALTLNLEEVCDGASDRLRPIVITSLTTVAGLFPTAYGFAGENAFITPMVMAMAWGVLFGTVVTLFLLPCLYMLEQDLRAWVQRIFVSGPWARKRRPS